MICSLPFGPKEPSDENSLVHAANDSSHEHASTIPHSKNNKKRLRTYWNIRGNNCFKLLFNYVCNIFHVL